MKWVLCLQIAALAANHDRDVVGEYINLPSESEGIPSLQRQTDAEFESRRESQ